MRGASLLALLLLLAACEKEPEFEERFDNASQEIKARAEAIDADIAEADKAARDAGEAVPRPNPSPSGEGQ